jgi:hypothetical protein
MVLLGKFLINDLLEVIQRNGADKAVTVDEEGGGTAYGRFTIFGREVGG